MRHSRLRFAFLLAPFLACGLATPAFAATYHTTLSTQEKRRLKIGEWLKVEVTLHRNNKTAGPRHRFDHTYRWYAFRSSDWKHFERGGRGGTPPPAEGSWRHADSKLETVNFWQGAQRGRYTLVCMTSKTGWARAGTIEVSVGTPRPRPRPQRFPASITVTPEGVTLYPGQQIQFSALVLDQRGRPMAAPLEMLAPRGGFASGQAFTAGSIAGTYDISFLHRPSNLSHTVRVTIVEPSRCVRLEVSPERARLEPGESIALRATAYDQYDQPMASALEYGVTGGGLLQGGTFTAGEQPGRYEIWVRDPQTLLTRSVSVTIVRPIVLSQLTFERPIRRARFGERIALTLQGWDQYNRLLPLGDMDWSCAAPARLTGDRIFIAPQQRGHYRVTVSDPETGLTAWADIFVYGP